MRKVSNEFEMDDQKSSCSEFADNVKHYIGTIKHALKYQYDNVFILHGYRINYNTPWLTFKSLFHKHNELINIWTHLIGAFIAFLLIVYIATSLNETRDKVSSDLQSIFDPIVNEFQSLKQYYNNATIAIGEIEYEQKLKYILSEIEDIENQIITSESYKKLVQMLMETKALFTLDKSSLLMAYSEQFVGKLQTIKNNIIQSIDSEQFDWMEIYRHDYAHADIIKQSHFIRTTQDPSHISRWPIVVFLISAIVCMMGSATFHLFFQMSVKAHKYLLRVDYGGISLLILGSTFPPFYYGFYCDTLVRYFYLFTVGSACLAVYVISIFDFIHREEWRKVKGFMYGSLGLFAAIPTIHLYIRESIASVDSDYLPFKDSFIYYLLMGLSYLGGLAIYVLRVPERFYPGKFDIIGHSHQIWHVCVFLGVLFSYIGAIDNLEDRRNTFCYI